MSARVVRSFDAVVVVGSFETVLVGEEGGLQLLLLRRSRVSLAALNIFNSGRIIGRQRTVRGPVAIGIDGD